MMGKTIVFSDLHANIFAAYYLKKVMAIAEDAWFLGDFFGRGPYIEETADFVNDYVKKYPHWVYGNHDAYVWNFVSKNTKTKYKRTTAETLDYHADILASRFNGDLKRYFTEERASLLWIDDFFALVHSTPSDPIGIKSSVMRPYYLQTILMDNLIVPFLKLARTRQKKNKRMANALLFCGHSHFPLFINYHEARGFKNYDSEIRYGKMMDIPDGITIVNTGSLGNPRIGSNTFIELDRERHQLAFHAFRLSKHCKKELVKDSSYLGFPSEEKMTFQNPPDKEKIRAEESEYYKIIETRERNGKIPETSEELCFG